MAVRIRNKATGAIVGVEQVVADGLLVSDQFEVVDDAPKAPAKKTASKPSQK